MAKKTEKVAKAAKTEKAPKVEKAPKAKKEAKQAAEAKQATNEEHQKWLDLKAKYGKEKASNYAMSQAFEAQSPIQHKLLGWGYVLANNNDRLEVLFETGTKILISNYNAGK